MRYSKDATKNILTITPDTPEFLTQKSIQVEIVKWRNIRRHRDGLLSASDWTQLSDSPLNDSQKEVWRVYRQALRDIPANFANAADVVWPEKP